MTEVETFDKAAYHDGMIHYKMICEILMYGSDMAKAEFENFQDVLNFARRIFELQMNCEQ